MMEKKRNWIFRSKIPADRFNLFDKGVFRALI